MEYPKIAVALRHPPQPAARDSLISFISAIRYLRRLLRELI